MFKIISIISLSCIGWFLLWILALMVCDEEDVELFRWWSLLLGGPLVWIIVILVLALATPEFITTQFRRINR